ncbi:RDD family protein [Agreia sp.]|uniref:RDD family protein n=1 Tax=Agreia sp. TaxID=1872416 RepID=UPI0035BBECC4
MTNARVASASAFADPLADAYADDELLIGEAVALDVRPAGFVLRAGGAAIDFVISVALLIVLVLGVGALAQSGVLDEALTATLSVSALVLCFVVVPTTLEVVLRGRSVGKLAVGARVVRDDGGAISIRHSVIRGLVGVLEIYLTLGAIAVVTALLNGRSKRLGDLLAGTYSQHERVPVPVSHARGVPVMLQAWAEVVDVARMPDRLGNRVAQFLVQAPRMAPATRERLAGELAAEVTPFVSPIPEVHPALFLSGVAAVRRDREYAALSLQKTALNRLDPLLHSLPHGFPRR